MRWAGASSTYDAPAIRKIVRDAQDGNYRFSSLIVGNREQHAVSNEEIANDHHEEGACRGGRFCAALGAALALPLLDAMVPSLTAAAETPASPAQLRRLGFVYMPMGCDITRWTPPGGETLDELVAVAQPAGRREEARRGDLESGAAERVSGNARDFERLVPQCGEGEADGEHRLLSRHDRRSDRRAADRPRYAACRRWSCRWT